MRSEKHAVFRSIVMTGGNIDMAVLQYVCSWQGCRTLLNTKGYCDQHRLCVLEREKIREQKRQNAFQNARRLNDALYRTKQWRMMRKKIVQRYPYCAVCGGIEKLHVDHIHPPRGNEALFFDIQNVQVLCEACHRQKTAAEIALRKGKGSGKNIHEVRKWLKRHLARL